MTSYNLLGRLSLNVQMEVKDGGHQQSYRESRISRIQNVFHPGENYWGVLIREDVNLDINNPRDREVVPAEQRKRWLVTSSCSPRNGRSIMTYKDKARYHSSAGMVKP